MLLHSFFRSGAAYRVRIALNLKGLAYEVAPRNLRRNEQHDPGYLAVNPQGLVPALETDGGVITQSLAICEYLDEVFPEPPLLPRDPHMRARVRAFADVIACDVHPIQNLKILKRLEGLGLSEAQVAAWAVETIENGFDACEALIDDQPGPFCFGDRPTLADVFLAPQFVNARRFGVELRWPRLQAAEAACLELPAFRQAAPDNQPDAA